MVVTIALFVLTIPIRIMVAVLSVFNAIIPSWMNLAITQTLGNSGLVGSVVPMQAHPGMWGLAGVTGLMPIIGFVLLLGGYIVTIRIVIYVGALFISLLPWHTSQVKQPHKLN
jgi:hypothetical protein